MASSQSVPAEIVEACLSWCGRYFKQGNLGNESGFSALADDLTLSELQEQAKEKGIAVDASLTLEQLTAGEAAFPCLLQVEDRFLILTEARLTGWHAFDLISGEETQIETDNVDAGHAPLLLGLALLEEEAEPSVDEKQPEKAGWLFKEIFRHKRIYRDTLIASVFINVIGLLMPLYTMNVYDKVVPTLAFDTLWYLSGIVLIAMIFDWVLKLSRAYLTDRVGLQIDQVLSTFILKRILGSQSEHRPSSTGSLAKAFQDFDGIRDFLNAATITALVDLPFVILMLVAIGMVGGWIIMAPIVVLILVLSTSLISRSKVMAQVKELASIKSQRTALAYEVLQNLDEIKLNNGKKHFLSQWQKQVESSSEKQFENNRLVQGTQFSGQFFQQSLTLAIIVSGVYLIAEGEMTMGALIAVSMLANRGMATVAQVSTLITRYQQAKEGIDSVNQLLVMPQERDASSVKPHRLVYNGGVTLDDVSFAYPEADMPTLSGVNLTIKPGEKVAVIGSIGSGKTTLVRLLQSLYLPTSGRILFDNLEARYWDADVLRGYIGSCNQQPSLFKGSIYENITLGLPVDMTDHHFIHTLRSTGLEKILQDLEGGLDRQLGESNHGISGGQAQTIAYCRALMKNPQLLILDEPTSMMDKVSESHIVHSLKNLPAHCTLVMATHNLNLLNLVDRVIILERGQIKYDGSVEGLRRKAEAA